jgi:hypothetical protein
MSVVELPCRTSRVICCSRSDKLAEPGGEYDPDTLPALAASYGCDVDFGATMPIAERHRLIF